MAIVLTVQGQYDGRQIDKAIRDLEQLKKYGASAAIGIGSAFEKQSASIKAFGDRVKSTGQSISSTGTTITRGLSIPLAAVGYASIKAAANFQVAMAQTQVATQATGKEMKSLSDLAIKLGQDTVFSATDAGNAMLNLAKGGLTKADIQGGALKSTLDLAAASGIDLAEAASTVTASMNTFGIKAGDVGVAVDALAGAAASSNAEMPDLMMALRQAGQSASMSGLSIQETTAALAAFADKGVIGSDAGTSFKVMLQRLTPQSKEAAVLMKELGLSFFDAEGNTKSLTQIAEQLQTGLSGLTEQQRKATLSTLFGTDAIRASNIMYELGGQGIQSYVDATTKSGTAAKFAQARMSGLYGVIEQLRGSIDTALIQNGEALEPTFTAITNAVKDLVNAYSSLSPKMQEGIAKAMMFGVVLGPVIKTVGLLTTGIGGTIKMVGTMWGAIGGGYTTLMQFKDGLTQAIDTQSAFSTTAANVGQKVRVAAFAVADWTKATAANIKQSVLSAAAWVKNTAAVVANRIATVASTVAQKAAAGAAKAWAAVQWVLNAALSANPIGLVVIGIGALVAAFVLAWRNSESFRKFVTAAFDRVLAAGRAVWGFFQNFGSRFLEVGREILNGIWSGIRNGASWLLDQIRGWANNILDNIRGFFGIASPSKHTEEYGKQIAAGLAVGMEGGERHVANASRKVSDAALKAMGLALDTGGKTVASKAKGVADKMAKELASATKKAKKVADDIRDALKSGLQDVIDSTRDAMDSMADQIFNALDAMAEAADRMVQAAQDGVDNMRNLYDDALGTLANLKDQASSYAGQIRDSLRAAFSLKDALSAEDGQSFLQNLRDQVKKFQKFSSQLTQLRSMGLNESSMQEIISAGVEQGTQIAAAILSGGGAAVAEINQLEAIVTREAQSFGDLLATDKFGAQLTKAKQNLDLADQNLKKANASLAAATASRDALVAQINSVRERTNQILGKSTDELDAMVKNLSSGIGNMATTIAGILNLIEAKMRNLSALATLSTSTQAQLAALNGTPSSGPITPGAPLMGSSKYGYKVEEMGGGITVPITINAATKASAEEIAYEAEKAVFYALKKATYL